jgi:hypothetical protein
MRSTILSAAVAATLALGTLHSPTAQATDVRVVVGLGDVRFDAGVPYYGVTREPVYVVYKDNVPTYYRVVARKTYKGEIVPPPWAPAYGWRLRSGRMNHGFYDADGVWHWD